MIQTPSFSSYEYLVRSTNYVTHHTALSPASDHFTPPTHLENVCIPLNKFSTLYGCNNVYAANVYAARSEMIIVDVRTHAHTHTMTEHCLYETCIMLTHHSFQKLHHVYKHNAVKSPINAFLISNLRYISTGGKINNKMVCLNYHTEQWSEGKSYIQKRMGGFHYEHESCCLNSSNLWEIL